MLATPAKGDLSFQMTNRRPTSRRHAARDKGPGRILVLLFVLLGVAAVIFDLIAANPFAAAIATLCLAAIATFCLAAIAWHWLKKPPPPAVVQATDPFVRFAPGSTSAAEIPASVPAPSDRPASPYEQLYADELARITACDTLAPQRIMNKGESQIFLGALAALDILKPSTRRWHVHAQPSLGELLTTQCMACSYGRNRALRRRCDSCYAVYKALNTKRPDLVICDNYGWPVLVIEHQGRGHIGRASPQSERESILRNEVKLLAVRKAGIALLETAHNTSTNEAAALIVARLTEVIAARSAPRSEPPQ